MEGFDDPGVFFSDNFTADDNPSDTLINLQTIKKKFKEFIRQYHTENFNYKYRFVTPHFAEIIIIIFFF